MKPTEQMNAAIWKALQETHVAVPEIYAAITSALASLPDLDAKLAELRKRGGSGSGWCVWLWGDGSGELRRGFADLKRLVSHWACGGGTAAAVVAIDAEIAKLTPSGKENEHER